MYKTNVTTIDFYFIIHSTTLLLNILQTVCHGHSGGLDSKAGLERKGLTGLLKTPKVKRERCQPVKSRFQTDRQFHSSSSLQSLSHRIKVSAL